MYTIFQLSAIIYAWFCAKHFYSCLCIRHCNNICQFTEPKEKKIFFLINVGINNIYIIYIFIKSLEIIILWYDDMIQDDNMKIIIFIESLEIVNQPYTV